MVAIPLKFKKYGSIIGDSIDIEEENSMEII